MRHYNFEFPVNVPGGFFGYVGILISRIQGADLWPSATTKGKLPVPLARRLADAKTNGTGVTITKVDLDSIPDDVWARVEALLPAHA